MFSDFMAEKSKYNPTLEENVFGEVKKVPTRDGFGDALSILGKKNPNVVVLAGDLCHSTRANVFKENFPERFFEVGIAEANMVGIAAGLSNAGKIPFVSTFGVFAMGRVWDQIRMSVCYSNYNVKIAASHCGIFSVGGDGYSHQSLEDITLARVLPNMRVLVPCDVIEAKKATIAAAEIYGPFFIRYGREKVPIVTTEDTPFEIGKAEIFREGSDIAVITCGSMVYEALIAAHNLEKEGIDVRVINNHTVKPIDNKTIIKAAKDTGMLVTVEEHQIMGGMGSAVAEIISQEYPVPIKMMGIMDKFGESGHPDDLKKKFGLTTDDITNTIREVIKKK